MLRGIFKKTCFIVNIMVLVICSNLLLAMGATGTSTISADKDKVLQGEQVTVHIEIKATEKLYYCEFLLNYDDTKLKFISTDGNADTYHTDMEKQYYLIWWNLILFLRQLVMVFRQSV